MNVQQIVDRVLDFALDETNADNNLENRVLGDVQEAYAEIQGLIAPITVSDYLIKEDVVITSGVGTISPNLYVQSVIDKTAPRKLGKTDVISLEERDLLLTNIGSPSFYFLQDNTVLNTYPRNNTTAQVRSFPLVNQLALADDESVIRVPPHLHQALVAGGIYYMAVREQGFHDRLDRGEKKQEWLSRKNKISEYYLTNNRKPLRVQHNDF